MKRLVLLFALWASPASGETVYSVYQGSTLELQFSTVDPLDNNRPVLTPFGPQYTQATVSQIMGPSGVLAPSDTPYNAISSNLPTGSQIFLQNPINSSVAALYFPGSLPMTDGTYALVPFFVSASPTYTYGGSHIQYGAGPSPGVGTLIAFPNDTIPLDTMVITDPPNVPEPGALTLALLGAFCLTAFASCHYYRQGVPSNG